MNKIDMISFFSFFSIVGVSSVKIILLLETDIILILKEIDKNNICFVIFTSVTNNVNVMKNKIFPR